LHKLKIDLGRIPKIEYEIVNVDWLIFLDIEMAIYQHDFCHISYCYQSTT